ncbi:MAG: hypothetical protein LBN24_03235 [Mediterranea sp.]|jgi:hypothetical protein|nr:hypothetical protein [Mediterranea sp.]
MKKQILSVAVALMIGSTVCLAQQPKNGQWQANREKRVEQMVTDLGLKDQQATDFKAALESMMPKRTTDGTRPSREEMQKQRAAGEAKIKTILTADQYKKYQDLRKQQMANRRGGMNRGSRNHQQQ